MAGVLGLLRGLLSQVRLIERMLMSLSPHIVFIPAPWPHCTWAYWAIHFVWWKRWSDIHTACHFVPLIESLLCSGCPFVSCSWDSNNITLFPFKRSIHIPLPHTFFLLSSNAGVLSKSLTMQCNCSLIIVDLFWSFLSLKEVDNQIISWRSAHWEDFASLLSFTDTPLGDYKATTVPSVSCRIIGKPGMIQVNYIAWFSNIKPTFNSWDNFGLLSFFLDQSG